MDKPFPAYTGDQPYIFVCYSHQDRDVVYQEIGWLHEQGVNVWYDEGISGGRNWRAVIGDSLLNAGHVLFYISRHSLESDHCNREINLALDEGKTVVPIYLEKVDLTSDLKVGLNRVQALFHSRDASHARDLLNALQGESGSPVLVRTEVNRGERHESQSPVPTIAVLPFTDMGNAEDYFSDGLAEEILNRMIGVREVRVVSRQSSFSYKDSTLDARKIGSRLGADYLLEGGVRRSDKMVRISVRLTDAVDGTELWGNTYDRELADVLRMQDEIAQAAISELVPNITVAPTVASDVDPTAYDLYLKARQARAANDPITAKSLLQGALAIAPEFADACGLLTSVHSSLRAFGPPHFDGDDQLRKSLRRALELDPENPDALLAQAHIQFDLAGSLSRYEAIIRRYPSQVEAYYGYGWMLDAALKNREHLLVAEHLRRTEHSTNSAIQEIVAHVASGNFDLAERAANRIPLDSVGATTWSGRREWLITWVYIPSGQLDKAEEQMKLLGQAPGIDSKSTADAKMSMAANHYAIWLAIERNQLDAARAIYRTTPMSIHNMPYNWLPFDVVLTGDTSRTLDEIENPTNPASVIWIMRLQRQDRWMSKHGSAPFKGAFDLLRRETRYQQALRKYGIDDESLAKIHVHTDELWD